MSLRYLVYIYSPAFFIFDYKCEFSVLYSQNPWTVLQNVFMELSLEDTNIKQ